jgi:hypothetical protein
MTLVQDFCAHSFMHVPVDAKTALAEILGPDDVNSPRVQEAVQRVIDAYHRAMVEFVAPGRGMWDDIETSPGKAPFFSALKQGDVDTVSTHLARMFQTDLIWGLGKVHESHPDDMRANPQTSHILLRVTDALVSLAQACGVHPVVCVQHQGIDAYLKQLDVNLDDVLEKVESKTKLDVSFPPVGAAYGCRIGGKLIAIDSLLHRHTLYRLRQLGAGTPSRVVEIGGGYGCMAYLAYRAGLRNYDVFDFPWVNLLQGYFLILSLPAGAVRLYGESNGDISITPHWKFGEISDGSIDFVINSDSLPEMALQVRRMYLTEIRRILRGCFLSINQESGASHPDPPASVGELAEQNGFHVLSRNRWWMNQGYIEEVLVPRDRP